MRTYYPSLEEAQKRVRDQSERIAQLRRELEAAQVALAWLEKLAQEAAERVASGLPVGIYEDEP